MLHHIIFNVIFSAINTVRVEGCYFDLGRKGIFWGVPGSGCIIRCKFYFFADAGGECFEH